MKVIKRSLVMVLVIVTLCSAMSVSAFASVWRTGDFYQSASRWTSAHTVTLNNSNQYSIVYLYAYKCDRGTGHSGSCKNSRRPGGYVNYQLKTTGSWKSPVQEYTSSYDVPGIALKGVKSYQIRLTLVKSKQYQHWALEGVSNVKAIS